MLYSKMLYSKCCTVVPCTVKFCTEMSLFTDSEKFSTSRDTDTQCVSREMARARETVGDRPLPCTPDDPIELQVPVANNACMQNKGCTGNCCAVKCT